MGEDRPDEENYQIELDDQECSYYEPDDSCEPPECDEPDESRADEEESEGKTQRQQRPVSKEEAARIAKAAADCAAWFLDVKTRLGTTHVKPGTYDHDQEKHDTASELRVAPAITSTEGLAQFLTAHFGECQTSLGLTKLAFVLEENTSTVWPYDYWIQVQLDPSFLWNLKSRNRVTTEMNHVVCAELRQYQEGLARATLAAMPDKKLRGGYSNYRCASPAELQLGYSAEYHDSWGNYSPTDASHYEEAVIIGFAWWPLIDTPWEH